MVHLPMALNPADHEAIAGYLTAPDTNITLKARDLACLLYNVSRSAGQATGRLGEGSLWDPSNAAFSVTDQVNQLLALQPGRPALPMSSNLRQLRLDELQRSEPIDRTLPEDELPTYESLFGPSRPAEPPRNGAAMDPTSFPQRQLNRLATMPVASSRPNRLSPRSRIDANIAARRQPSYRNNHHRRHNNERARRRPGRLENFEEMLERSRRQGTKRREDFRKATVATQPERQMETTAHTGRQRSMDDKFFQSEFNLLLADIYPEQIDVER